MFPNYIIPTRLTFYEKRRERLFPSLLTAYDVFIFHWEERLPFDPASEASLDVNSCAVPNWWAAFPPLLAISRCLAGSIAPKPLFFFAAIVPHPLSFLTPQAYPKIQIDTVIRLTQIM